MQFPGPKASLVVTIHLCFQSISDLDVPRPDTITSRMTQDSPTPDANPDGERSTTPSPSPSDKLQRLPPNIPQNLYKGPHYLNQQCPKPLTDPDITPDPTVIPMVPNPVHPGDLNIKIIGAIPFTRLLQEGTPAFQLQVTPALPEEYLRTGTTTPESKTEEQILSEVVPPEYHEFTDVFSKGSAKELPPHRSYDHKIDLEEGTSPPFGKIYNMSEIELWALKEYLDDMLGKGFICPSISVAGAPVLFAKKKDRSLQLCVDYWELNKVTKKNRYPLPLIGDLVDRLRSAKIYTKINLHSGYNNVRIATGYKWKTAFCTHYGLFEYLVMPFGMTNSPATFQYFMNDIFHDMNDVFVIVYLDDILIYLNSLAEHSEHCSFHTVEVEYLGVIITSDGVRMDPTKVDAILNWPSPQNVKEVQSFLGACEPCLQAKVPRHRPHGLLKPLPDGRRPWSSISMDHIVELPDSEGFDAILVVVCRLTKQALFIPCHTTDTALDFAKLFLKHVFSKHGLPDDIVSDHRPLFVSHFWQSLCKALEIKTSLSTAYHPETNGQTKHVNQTLEQYLCLYINYLQNNWHAELPLTKFTYNNTPHSATRVSPFYANKGYNPRLTLSLKDISSHIAHKVAEDLRSLHQFLRDKINTTNQAYSKHANACRKPTPDWPPGTLVWLNWQNLKTWRPSIKLNHKRLGPFKVLWKVSTHAYKLDLPLGLKGLHPVFHV
ncbi:hypothetical protein E4T56_gene20411 [Termitomyces sp. T112]|nr:hypothetical protein E4T56_gene20411 [Termitomyces sp. T112]